MAYIHSHMDLHMCAKFGANRPSRLVAFPDFVLRLIRLFAAVRADSRKNTQKNHLYIENSGANMQTSTSLAFFTAIFVAFSGALAEELMRSITRARTSARMRARKRTRMRTHTHTTRHMHTHVQPHARTHVRVPASAHTHARTYARTYAHTYADAHEHTYYTLMRTLTHAHSCTHTHTLMRLQTRRVTWGKAPLFGDDLSLTYLFASTSEKSYVYVTNYMLCV